MSSEVNLLELIEEWDEDIEYSESDYYAYYEKMGEFSGIYENIKSLYESKWSIDRPFPAGLTATVERWLGNYELDPERKVAFQLIPRIMVYSKKEMEVLCEITFEKLVQLLESHLGRIVDKSFFNSNVFFVPLTDSGGNWCRYLRHHYDFESSAVKQSIDVLKPIHYSHRKYIVVVEDFVGSGSDVVKEYTEKLAGVKRIYSDVHFYLFALIATKWGVDAVDGETEFNVVVGEMLDSRYKCFSKESVVYSDTRTRAEAKRVFSKYGRRLCDSDPEISGCPLGFDNGQLAVVLHDNTPDNTLPVIWYPDKGWFPFFRRSRRYHGDTGTV